jgi:hypothetical protein
LILPLYVTLDYNGSITQEYISILAIYYLILLIQRYRTPPNYNKGVYYFVIISEVVLTWFTIVSVIHAFLDFGEVDDIGLLYLVIGIPFVSLAYVHLLDRREWTLMRTSIKAFKKETDIEMYVNLLMDLIETREKAPSRYTLDMIHIALKESDWKEL